MDYKNLFGHATDNTASKREKALSLIEDALRDLGASVMLVASQNGEALLFAGDEEPRQMGLLAALGAAGLSALQEVIMTAFSGVEGEEEQLMTLEVSDGLIVLLSSPPVMFLAVFRDKSRLGLARLLLKRLVSKCDWDALLPNEADHVSLEEKQLQHLLEGLWEN